MRQPGNCFVVNMDVRVGCIISDNTLSYIVFRMAQSEPSSGVKGKAIYNKNLSNKFDSFLAQDLYLENIADKGRGANDFQTS